MANEKEIKRSLWKRLFGPSGDKCGDYDKIAQQEQEVGQDGKPIPRPPKPKGCI